MTLLAAAFSRKHDAHDDRQRNHFLFLFTFFLHIDSFPTNKGDIKVTFYMEISFFCVDGRSNSGLLIQTRLTS